MYTIQELVNEVVNIFPVNKAQPELNTVSQVIRNYGVESSQVDNYVFGVVDALPRYAK